MSLRSDVRVRRHFAARKFLRVNELIIGKPAARRGRKASGLAIIMNDLQIAGLPTT
jgi:hypothetical protein